MYKDFKINLLKSICFIIIAIVLFFIIQEIMIPKYYYPDNTISESASRNMPGFYEEETDSIEVLFFGTSHVLDGISPMEIYENYGITSYNLGMLRQPIDVSYYLLKEALKYQSQKVVVYDVSSLFSKGEAVNWHYMLDEMPISLNKLEMSIRLTEEYKDESLIGALFPFFNYHDRWTNLTERDFTDFFRNKRYYTKGNYVTVQQLGYGITVENMNEQESEMINQDTKVLIENNNGVLKKENVESSMWNPKILDDSVDYLLKMKSLCDENDIEFLMTKVPSVTYPILNGAAWTEQKYYQVKELAEKYGIEYLDMVYDADLEIDWWLDTIDGGSHLNILGAIKSSDAIGDYLIKNYELIQEENIEWNKDLEIYHEVKKMALLNLENDFMTYVNKLVNEYSDKVIFMAVSNDFSSNWSEEQKQFFRDEFGLKIDLSEMYRGAYVAVIEQGVVTYEASSNRKINYKGKTLIGDRSYDITSSGYYPLATAQIIIEGVNYSAGGEGLNIVVYDPESDLIIDSAWSDFYSADHIIKRKSNNSMNQHYLRVFENYIIESTKGK